MNLSPFQTWNLIPRCEPPGLTPWHHEQGYVSWQKQNQQHGGKASSPAHRAGSKCLNPWLDAESSKVPGAFLTCWSTAKGTSRPSKRAISAGGLQHLAVTASCHTCSGSLLLAKERSIRRTNEGGNGWHQFPFPIPNLFSSSAGHCTFMAVTFSEAGCNEKFSI